MTEKKTFKNPNFVSGYAYGADGPHWEVHNMDTESSLSGELSRAEWDMEVIFTKKPVKPEVGGTCRLSRYGQSVYTIIAVDNDLAWVRDQGESHEENTGWIEPISKMLDVRPWAPA